jgi:hypothetical protein
VPVGPIQLGGLVGEVDAGNGSQNLFGEYSGQMRRNVEYAWVDL